MATQRLVAGADLPDRSLDCLRHHTSFPLPSRPVPDRHGTIRLGSTTPEIGPLPPCCGAAPDDRRRPSARPRCALPPSPRRAPLPRSSRRGGTGASGSPQAPGTAASSRSRYFSGSGRYPGGRWPGPNGVAGLVRPLVWRRGEPRRQLLGGRSPLPAGERERDTGAGLDTAPGGSGRRPAGGDRNSAGAACRGDSPTRAAARRPGARGVGPQAHVPRPARCRDRRVPGSVLGEEQRDVDDFAERVEQRRLPGLEVHAHGSQAKAAHGCSGAAEVTAALDSPACSMGRDAGRIMHPTRPASTRATAVTARGWRHACQHRACVIENSFRIGGHGAQALPSKGRRRASR
jgi:hypothetical protein